MNNRLKESYGYISVYDLMEYCQNLIDKKVDCNDLARFPRASIDELRHYCKAKSNKVEDND